MKSHSELSIYDEEIGNEKIKENRAPIMNIHEATDRILYKFVFGPLKCVKFHTAKWSDQTIQYMTRHSVNWLLSVNRL